MWPPPLGPAAARGSQQGAAPDRLWGAPTPLPLAGRPGMLLGLDVAAPPASRLVRFGQPRAASVPGHAGLREGGHQVSGLLEPRLPSPAPETWRHTWRLPWLGAVGMDTEFQSFGSGEPSVGSNVTHTCPVVGWLRVGVTSP